MRVVTQVPSFRFQMLIDGVAIESASELGKVASPSLLNLNLPSENAHVNRSLPVPALGCHPVDVNNEALTYQTIDVRSRFVRKVFWRFLFEETPVRAFSARNYSPADRSAIIPFLL